MHLYVCSKFERGVKKRKWNTCCVYLYSFTHISDLITSVWKQCLDSRGRVLEQPVVRVKHLLGHEEEPLPRHTSIVQSFLSLKLHPQSCLQQVRSLNWENASVRVFQHRVSSHLHLKAVWDVSLHVKYKKKVYHHLQVKLTQHIWNRKLTLRKDNTSHASSSFLKSVAA